MKRFFAVMMSLIVLVFATASAEDVFATYGIELSSLSDAELSKMAEMIDDEINARNQSEGSVGAVYFPGVIFDESGYTVDVKQVSCTEYEGNLIIDMETHVQNGTDYNIEVDLSIESIDGWDTRSSVGTSAIRVSPQKKTAGSFSFFLRDMGYKSIEDIGSFEFEISVWDKDKSLHNLYRSDILTGDFK